jgi:hypothetical protein
MPPSDLEALIDRVLDVAERAYAPAPWVLEPTRPRDPWSNRWTAEEERFVVAHVGVLSHDQIGEALGRSAAAIHIRITRRQLPAASRRPGWLTGNQVARILGVDIHAVCAMHKRGILQFVVLPGPRKILNIRQVALHSWAVNPEHWIYFKVEKITDPYLNRLVELARSRWEDAWWTTEQVTAYHGLVPRPHPRQNGKIALSASNLVEKHILDGILPGKRWGNWYVKRSDAVAHVFRTGKGSSRPYPWTPRADAWILRARDELGLSWEALGRTMRGPCHETIRKRYYALKQRENV